MSQELESPQRKVKFRTNNYSPRIEEIEIEAETAHFIKRVGYAYRDAKVSGYYSYFDTYELAKAYLMEQALSRLASAEGLVRRAKAIVAEVEQLRQW